MCVRVCACVAKVEKVVLTFSGLVGEEDDDYEEEDRRRRMFMMEPRQD